MRITCLSIVLIAVVGATGLRSAFAAESPTTPPATGPANHASLVEEARAAAKAAGDLDGRVKLIIVGRAENKNTYTGRLINTTDRTIYFTAYVNEPENDKVPNAGDTAWTPLHGADHYVSGKWREFGGMWCGTGAGEVALQPGKEAKVNLVEFQKEVVWRARLPWRFTHGNVEKHEGGEAVSDIIERN